MATTEPDVTSPGDRPKRDRKMSLAGHLHELRKRLMFAAIGLIVGMAIAFVVTDFVISLLLVPIQIVAENLGDDFTRLAYSGVTSAFDMRVRIAFTLGIVISAPVWLWQIWAFVMPGLTRREVGYTIGFLATAVPLFFAGCALAFYLLPNIILLMSSFVPEEDFASQFYESSTYYDFAFKMILIVGVAFVLPVFLVGLNLAGITSGMAILKGWRFAIVVALVFGALASPPADMVTMGILAGVLLVLYFAAVGVSLLFDWRRAHAGASWRTLFRFDRFRRRKGSQGTDS